MEALTIRQIRDRHIREQGEKLYKKELRSHQKTEIRRQEEARMRQEEARMRQEAEKMRQEEARIHKEKLAISVVKLYSKGFSAENIADVLLESLETVNDIIKKHPSV